MCGGSFSLFFLLMLFANCGAALSDILRMRVAACIEIIVPSLFACMVMSNLLRKSGAADVMGKLIGIPMRRLGWDSRLCGAFLLSQIAGYPVGALILHDMVRRGELSRSTARRLSPAFFGGGPSFAVGLAGAQLFGSAGIGWMIWLIGVFANACLLWLLCHGKITQIHIKHQFRFRISPDLLTESVADAMCALWGICGVVLFFGVVGFLLDFIGFTSFFCRICMAFGATAPQASNGLSTLLDVTQLPSFCRCGIAAGAALPCAAGFLSFGGVCVLIQCAALGGDAVSLPRLFFCRFFVGILTAILTAIFVPLVFKNDVSSVFLTYQPRVSVLSPIASVLIFLTGFPILLKKDWTK